MFRDISYDDQCRSLNYYKTEGYEGACIFFINMDDEILKYNCKSLISWTIIFCSSYIMDIFIIYWIRSMIQGMISKLTSTLRHATSEGMSWTTEVEIASEWPFSFLS